MQPSVWLQSAVTKTHIMLQLFFIDGSVESGIMRFLGPMHVLEVRESSCPRLPLCQSFSFTASITGLAHGEKLHTQSLIQSITQLFDALGTKELLLKFSTIIIITITINFF